MFIRNFFVKFLLCSKFTLREKCPDSEFFWAVFFRFRTPNAGKCKPEELQIRTLFTQCYSRHFNLDVSSWEFDWEDVGVLQVKNGFLEMLKSQIRQKKKLGESVPVNTYCRNTVFFFKSNICPKKLFVSCVYCCCLFDYCLCLFHSNANVLNIEYLIFKYQDKIHQKDGY